jgi:prevent-host-death family protein
MKTATVRELRNNYTKVLGWVSSGEDVAITRRGQVVAKVIPPSIPSTRKLDWNQSAALRRPASARPLTAEESAKLLSESQGY